MSRSDTILPAVGGGILEKFVGLLRDRTRVTLMDGSKMQHNNLPPSS
ncbi:MAG: hypothetical protein JSS81_06605 [Acidobacteria bacterium]|nr:hypothetical protein [Acidobacteriota bacterium]